MTKPYLILKCVDCDGHGYTEALDYASGRTYECFECDGSGEREVTVDDMGGPEEVIADFGSQALYDAYRRAGWTDTETLRDLSDCEDFDTTVIQGAAA